jgi:acetyl esterase/lipase
MTNYTEVAAANPAVTSYPAAEGFAGPRPAVLVLPGGGYRFHAAHEGEGYARWLSHLGLHAFVLEYPLLTEHRFPAPLLSARAALGWVRDGGHGLAVDTGRVGVIGSSAGGHLAGLLATGAVLTGETGAPATGTRSAGETWVPPRPDFAVLAYAPADLRLLPDAPVSWMLGGRMELRDELSPVRQVDADTCAMFLWATAEDPPGFANALAFATALVGAGVPAELHIYPHGRHGLGLADGVSYGGQGEIRVAHTARWADACAAWLRAEGFLPE